MGVGTATPQGAFVVTNGNVGIGTWAPISNLSVAGSAIIGSGAAYTNGTNAPFSNGLIVQGNVGIGTFESFYKLDLFGSNAASGTMRLRTQTSNSGLIISTISANTNARNWAILANSLTYGDFTINQSYSHLGDPVSGISRLYFDPSGNIGLGTTTPQSKMIIMGNVGLGTWTAAARLDTDGIRLSTNPASGYVLVSGATGIGTWMAPASIGAGVRRGGPLGRGTVYTTTGTDNVGIGTTFTTMAGLTVMNGNVGIGTWVPNSALQVNGNMVVSNDGTAYTAYLKPLYIAKAGTTEMRIHSTDNSGSVGIMFQGAGDRGNIYADNSYKLKMNSNNAYSNGAVYINNSDSGTVSLAAGGGNVGVGTITPQGGFVVTNGSVGMGTWAPIVPLQIVGVGTTSAFGGDWC